MYSRTTHIININQAGVGYYLHREGPNLGKNIMSLVSCYHPALTHSSGPPTRDQPVLTPTLLISLRVPLCDRQKDRWLACRSTATSSSSSPAQLVTLVQPRTAPRVQIVMIGRGPSSTTTPISIKIVEESSMKLGGSTSTLPSDDRAVSPNRKF